MDMSFSVSGPLLPEDRALLAHLREQALRYCGLGSAPEIRRLKVETDHRPEGEGFTLRPAHSGRQIMLEFIHLADPDPDEPFLSFHACTDEDGGVIYKLEDSELGARSWAGPDSQAEMMSAVEEAIFDWVLKHSRKPARAPERQPGL